MGVMNLLKSKWDGKVGETVGAKWKNRSTIRTYSKPSNPNTEAQQSVRGAFKQITSFVALFADGIKYKSALDTSGMSVRNAIIKLNKTMIQTGTVTLSELQISKGGLQKPQGVAATSASGLVTVTWTAPTASNFTSNAQMICVAVDATGQVSDVFEAVYSAGTATGTVALTAGNTAQVFAYYLDKRGSSKVASNSVALEITVA